MDELAKLLETHRLVELQTLVELLGKLRNQLNVSHNSIQSIYWKGPSG